MRATVLLLLAFACSDDTATDPANAVEAAAPQARGSQSNCEEGWREVLLGLRQRNLCADGEATLHLVEIDRARWTLDAVRVAPTTAPAVARERSAPFAINANFFDTERKTLGVVVSGGEMLQSPHRVSWQSIFYTTSKGKAAIVLPEKWDAISDDAAMAVQAGPRLVADGRATGARRGHPSLRSGVCLTRDGRIVFFATTARRLYDVAEMTGLAVRSADRGGLGCHDAMLFDGGPSAQMYLAESGISMEGDRVPAFVIARQRDGGVPRS